MGSSGRIAVGARGQLAFAEEHTWGVPLPPSHRVNFKTESFNNEIGNLVTEALDPSRGIAKRVRGTSNITGDVAIELNTEGYEVWYKHAFGDAISLAKTDGGVRTRLTANYVSGTSLVVEDTSVFNDTPGADWGLTVVYKSSTTGLLVSQAVVYSALASATEFTITDPSVALPKGAWVFQTAIGVNDVWDPVYTHYIEAAKDLPAGMTFEVGRDVAFFVYNGCKVNTIENNFNAQEILQGTVGLIGKAEYSGGDLLSGTTEASTSINLTNYTPSYRNTDTAYRFITSGSVWSDQTSEANDDVADDVSPFAAVPAADDIFYFGSENKFFSVGLNLTTAHSSLTGFTSVWEYYDGSAWSTLTFKQQGLNTFAETTGIKINAFNPPANWAKTTLGTTPVTARNAYWIRVRCTGYTSGTPPTFGRVWMDYGIVGFNFGGMAQVGSENDIAYTGVALNLYAGTASLTGVSGWAANSIHNAGEPVAPQSSWDEPINPPSTDMLSSFQAAVYMDGVATEVLNGNWNLNNNLYTDKFQLGDRYRAGLPEQQRTVEGLIHVEFDDLILYHKFINGTPAMLEFRSVDDTEIISDTAPAGSEVYRQFHVIFPNIEFTGTTPQIGGPEVIENDMNFTALKDEDNNMNEIAVIFVNTQNLGF